MAPELRRAIWYTGFVLALVLAGLGLMVGPLIVGELIAQGRVDRVFVNELCRGIFTVGNDAKVVLGTVAGGSNGSVVMWVRNLSGSNVGAGRFMVHRSTAVTVVSSVGSSVSNATIANNLSSFKTASETVGAKFVLYATATGTAGSADSIYVKGLDANGVTQSGLFKLLSGASSVTQILTGSPAAAAGRAVTPLFWAKVDSVSMAHQASSATFALAASPFAAVDVASSASTDFAGVSVDSMANNALGRICIHGPVQARVNSGTTALTPGALIELAGWGVGVTDASATTAQNVAKALQYAKQDSQLTQVFVDNY